MRFSPLGAESPPALAVHHDLGGTHFLLQHGFAHKVIGATHSKMFMMIPYSAHGWHTGLLQLGGPIYLDHWTRAQVRTFRVHRKSLLGRLHTFVLVDSLLALSTQSLASKRCWLMACAYLCSRRHRSSGYERWSQANTRSELSKEHEPSTNQCISPSTAVFQMPRRS